MILFAQKKKWRKKRKPFKKSFSCIRENEKDRNGNNGNGNVNNNNKRQ